MASLRLTKEKRTRLIRLCVKKSFEKRSKALLSAEKKLGDACYRRRYSDEELQAMLNFDDCDKVFKWQDYIRCSFCGQSGFLSMSERRPFWYDDFESKVRFGPDDELTKMWNKFQEDSRALEVDKRELRNELSTFLNQYTTVKKLLETWPEGTEFAIEAGLLDEPAPPPMKSPERLNEMLCNFIGAESPTC